MNHKTAGLYVNLVKALNALEENGEDVGALGLMEYIEGNSAAVRWDSDLEAWRVVEA